MSKMGTASHLQPTGIPGVAPESQRVEDPLWKDQQATTGSRSETGDAIVVGAIGSAAPWFLTGWVHEVEIEFMIDTGCQVTILSTTVFERMCVVDLTVRSELRPCRRRLVSADSSSLMVQGQLELAIVFQDCVVICCLWWPTSDLTDCWAQRPYSPTSHISWICVQESCWVGGMGGLHCSCTNSG